MIYNNLQVKTTPHPPSMELLVDTKKQHLGSSTPNMKS